MKRVASLVLLALGLCFALASAAPPAEDEDASTSRRDAGSTDRTSGTDTSSSTDSGGSATCTMDQIFFDQSSTVCGTDQYCTIDENFAPICFDNAAAAGGANYGDCGSQGECPVGAGCFGSAAPGTCYPFCSTTATTCPNDSTGAPGLCIYSIQGAPTTLRICAKQDTCDAVDNSGCETGEGCYLIVMSATQYGNICSTAGTVQAGGACSYVDDCIPGYICAGSAAPGTCTKMCHVGNNADCTSPAVCNNVGHPTYGACGAAAADGGAPSDAASAG